MVNIVIFLYVILYKGLILGSLCLFNFLHDYVILYKGLIHLFELVMPGIIANYVILYKGLILCTTARCRYLEFYYVILYKGLILQNNTSRHTQHLRYPI